MNNFKIVNTDDSKPKPLKLKMKKRFKKSLLKIITFNINKIYNGIKNMHFTYFYLFVIIYLEKRKKGVFIKRG